MSLSFSVHKKEKSAVLTFQFGSLFPYGCWTDPTNTKSAGTCGSFDIDANINPNFNYCTSEWARRWIEKIQLISFKNLWNRELWVSIMCVDSREADRQGWCFANSRPAPIWEIEMLGRHQRVLAMSWVINLTVLDRVIGGSISSLQALKKASFLFFLTLAVH